MKELTTQEALQAVIDDKKVEFRGVVASCADEWRLLNIHNTSIDVLTSGLFMFRLAQEMITIGGVSFPKPESEPLEVGTEYWLLELHAMHCSRATPNVWHGSEYDLRHLRKGLVHLTPQNARLHGEALITLSGGNPNDVN